MSLTLEQIQQLPQPIMTSLSANVYLKQKLYLKLFEEKLKLPIQEVLRRTLQIGIARFLEEYYTILKGDMSIEDYTKQKSKK